MRALLNCVISSRTTGSLRMVSSATAWRRWRSAASRRAGVSSGTPASSSSASGWPQLGGQRRGQLVAQGRRAQGLALDHQVPARRRRAVVDGAQPGLHGQFAHQRRHRALLAQALHQAGPAVAEGRRRPSATAVGRRRSAASTHAGAADASRSRWRRHAAHGRRAPAQPAGSAPAAPARAAAPPRAGAGARARARSARSAARAAPCAAARGREGQEAQQHHRQRAVFVAHQAAVRSRPCSTML